MKLSNIDAHYVSTSEACWRLFHYDMHEEKPNVVQLAVHSEGGHSVVFNSDDTAEDILDAASTKDSTLTAYFKANEAEKKKADENPDGAVLDARSLLYQEFPTKWVWNKAKKKWTLQKKGSPAVGRMYFVHPAAGEQFYV